MPALSLLSLVVGLFGCAENPVFNKIREVEVRQIGPEGLVEKTFEGPEADRIRQCLYKSKEIDGDEGKQLLQSTYLLQVKDNYGERSFELYTESNMKGNKGKYYTNDCIYGLVR